MLPPIHNPQSKIKNSLNDRLRWFKFALAIALVVSACLYSIVQGPRQGLFYVDCIKSPAAKAGQTVMAVVCPIVAVNPDGLTIRHQGLEVKVCGDTCGARVGQYADVLGRFHSEGWIELDKIHVHSGNARIFKLAVSIIPLVFLGALAWKWGPCLI